PARAGAAGADRGGGAVDGRLSRKLPRADARRRKGPAPADRPRQAGRRCPADAAQESSGQGRGGPRVMNWIASLQATLPELVLSVGALALMLVAAWGGQGSTRAVSWTAVAVLLGA